MQYKYGLIQKIQAQIHDAQLSSRPFWADILYLLPLAHTHKRGPSSTLPPFLITNMGKAERYGVLFGRRSVKVKVMAWTSGSQTVGHDPLGGCVTLLQGSLKTIRKCQYLYYDSYQ